MSIAYYAIYNSTTGVISTRLHCDSDDVALNCTAAQSFIECSSDVTDAANVVDVTQTPPVVIAKPAPSAAVQLATAQAAKIAALTTAYNAALIAPVSFTNHAGVTASFNQAASDIANLQKAITGSALSGTWALNLWQDKTGAVVTPFTYADLQGLAAAMEAADTPQYVHLLTLLAGVTAAPDLASVAAINW